MTVPIHNLTDVWDDGGTTFTAIKMDVDNTASAAASKLIELLENGVSRFSVKATGEITGSSFSSSTKGLVPASGGGSTNFLRADGSWAAPPGVSDISDITGLGTGVESFLISPTSANLRTALTDETGTGAAVFATSPGFTTAANPISNDGAALGTTSLGWSDLHLASGAVLNWANGNSTITHSSGLLTMGVGDLIVREQMAVGSHAQIGIVATAPGGQEEEENPHRASFAVNDYVHSNPIFGGQGIAGYFGINAEGNSGGVNSFIGLDISVCGNVENIGDFNGGLYVSSIFGLNFSNTVAATPWYYYGSYVALYDYGNLALPCRSNYADFIAIVAEPQHRGTGTVTNVIGVQVNAGSGQSGGASGACTNLIGIDITAVGTFQSITNNYGIRIQDRSAIGASSKNYNFISEGLSSTNVFEGRSWMGHTSIGYSYGGAFGTLNYAANGSIDWVSQVVAYGNNALFPGMVFAKTRGTSPASLTVVQNGDELGLFAFYGAASGSASHPAAELRVRVDGTPGVSDMPGRFEFYTTPDGSATSIERMRIDNAGRVVIGGSTAVASAKLQVVGTSSAAAFSLNRYQNAAFGPVLALNLSRSGVIGTETIVQSGDGLGFLQGYGSDGTQATIAGEMRFEVDGTPGTNDMPGRIVFATTPDGAAAVTERMRIDNSGHVNIGRVGAGATDVFIPVRFEVATPTDFWNTRFHAYGNDTSPVSNLFTKTRSTSVTGVTALQNNDDIGQNVYYGTDGTGNVLAAAMIASVDGAVSTGVVPGRFSFYTSNSSGSFLERLRINSAGLSTFFGPVKTLSTTVGALPSASTSGSGARAFVTDANATTFLSTVAGGGANKVPVVSDGTNWLIG